MKLLYSIFFSLLLLTAFGQRRYLDASFDVESELDIQYATNISVLSGAPEQQDLFVDVYMPANDNETNRPLVLIAHTGSFLPPIINGQATGSTRDSSVVVLCQELAARGYVVGAFGYRLGWNPVGDEDTRRGTLLQAAYRGIQDTRTCARFFRRSVAEDNNRFGINPDQIAIIGVGTGGYLAMGAATLYDFEEVTLDKFISTTTNFPYIDQTVHGDLFGEQQAAINIPNHVGYSSDIGFSFNLGGAMGDQSWVDEGDSREAPMAGVHCPTDIFAPYVEGPVIVPTTNEFVVNVSGTRAAMQYANERGNNDIFSTLDPANDPLSAKIETQKITDVVIPTTMQTVKLGTDNFYGMVRPFPEGSPWDWWDKNVLDATVAFINANVPGADYDSDEIHQDGLLTNSDMSPQKGRIYLDTALQLFLPRACVALDLGCNFTNNDEIDDSLVELEFGPNPAINQVNISASSSIKGIQVFNTQGGLVRSIETNQQNYSLDLESFNRQSLYFIQIEFEEGVVMKKLIIQ